MLTFKWMTTKRHASYYITATFTVSSSHLDHQLFFLSIFYELVNFIMCYIIKLNFIIFSLFYYYTAHLTFYFHFPSLFFCINVSDTCFVARDELENCLNSVKFLFIYFLVASGMMVVWFVWFTFTWFHVIYGDPPLMQNFINV